MDAFQLLCRGGAMFNKRRFGHDVRLFRVNRCSKATVAGTETEQKGIPRQKNDITTAIQDEAVPTELDFFRYAQGTKRKLDHQDEPTNPKRWRQTTQDPRGDVEDEGIMDSQLATLHSQRITTKGINVPHKVESFEQLEARFSVSNYLSVNLKNSRYIRPTCIQSYGIPILMQGRDLAAISPTGTGKTLSYLLPIFSCLEVPAASDKNGDAGNGVRALILAPTRELAHQIYNECLKLALGRKWKIVLFSKATANALSEKSIRDKVDIIISTPLRLVASLQEGTINLDNVRFLVLDEADRLLDSEFLPQIEEIVIACTHAVLQKAVFSATLPAGVEKIAMSMLRDPIRVVVGLKDTPLPLISQTLTYVADDQSKLPTLLTYLSQPYEPPVLIFAATQTRATSLAEELIFNGVRNVDCLHAGMTNKEREDAISRMLKGESWIMISTEVMARGMDFKGVRAVINYDFPTNVQSYVHRIGRTGRAGREGKAVTYFTDDDAPFLKPIATVLSQSGSSVPDWMLKLPKPSRMKRKVMGKISRSKMINVARKIGPRGVKKGAIIKTLKKKEQNT